MHDTLDSEAWLSVVYHVMAKQTGRQLFHQARGEDEEKVRAQALEFAGACLGAGDHVSIWRETELVEPKRVCSR